MIFKRPQYVALGALTLLTLGILKLPPGAASRLKLAVGGVFLPLFGLAGSTQTLTDKTSQKLISRQELTKQVAELEKQNRELRLRAMQWNAVAQENLRLRSQLGLVKQHPDWRLKLGRVVARDPANWWRSLRIDLGARDGVTTNAPVMTAEGLVGRVSEVSFAQSQVVLLGDPDCRVAVLVEETRDHGVIAPEVSGPLDDSLVDITLLSRSSQLKAGQRVVTSGFGGIFPKGIPVGHVVDTHSVGYGLYVEARMKLLSNVGALEELWVKLP
jgi:rod shape-determining protein MreC